MSLFCIYALFFSNDGKSQIRALIFGGKITLVCKSTVFNTFPEIVISSGAYKLNKLQLTLAFCNFFHSETLLIVSFPESIKFEMSSMFTRTDKHQ